MDKRILLAIAGFAGTGKSTLARHLADKYNFHLVEGSALLRAVASARGIALEGRADFDALNRQLQLERGISWITDAMLSLRFDRLLQSGLRSPGDCDRLHQAGGKIIALSCPPEICVARINTHDPKNPQTIEEYIKHQQLDTSPDEYGSNTAWVLAHADYTIDTSGSTEATCAAADKIVDMILHTR